MTFEEAIKESISKYYDKNFKDEDLESNKATPNKYNRKYFDTFEEEILGEEVKNKKVK